MARRPMVWLVGYCTLLAAIVCRPLASSGYLLVRDAVSTPRSHVSDATLGLGDMAPRAVPQDWFVALASAVVDGGTVVKLLILAAVLMAGIGYGRMALRLVPGCGLSGSLVAATVAVWNPFVVERLMQGQWSLLLGYAMLGWVVVLTRELSSQFSVPTVIRLGSAFAVAGLTPTGALFAIIVGIVTLRTRDLRTWCGTALLAVIACLPWLTAAALGSGGATSDPAGAQAFAARAEPGLSTIGSLAGLGGIWNAQAVPDTRTTLWALVATVALLAVVVAGLPALWRRRRIAVYRRLFALAAVVLVLAALAATGPGLTVMRAGIDHVPGFGLLRDGQKWVALVIPFYALSAAAGIRAARRYVPAGFAAAVALVLVIAPLPDAITTGPASLGSTLRPVHYPADFTRVAAMIPADRGDVLLLPDGMLRRYDFVHGQTTLDPLPRMLRADVLQTGVLTIDGRSVDATDGRAAAAQQAIASGATPQRLAELGVGWVILEPNGPLTDSTADSLRHLQLHYAGPELIVYRIPDPVIHQASTVNRVLAWLAHGLWLALVVSGPALALAAALRRRRRSRPESPVPTPPHR